MPSFDASAPLLGYLYQVLSGLHVLLRDEEFSLKIEGLDDLTLSDHGQPTDLLQIKFHSKPASVSNTSRELWKTLRVWCLRKANDEIDTDVVHLHLVTTSTAQEGSAAAYLRPGKGRDTEEAHRLLYQVASESKDNELRSRFFPPFKDLSNKERLELLGCISVADNSPNIGHLDDAISERLSIATYRERRESLVERVKGWWLDRAVANLRDPSDEVSGRELFDYVARVAEQLKPDALPIDFFDCAPSRQKQESLMDQIFVAQLREVDVSTKRIEKAVADYHRAFEQRSRWVREDLLVDRELEVYEARLVDEWERFKLTLEDEEDISRASEETMQCICLPPSPINRAGSVLAPAPGLEGWR